MTNEEYALSILERLQKRIRMRGRNSMANANKARKAGRLKSGTAVKMINRAEVWEMAAYMLEEEMEALRNG